MEEDTTLTRFHQPGTILDPLTGIVREDARRIVAVALRPEAARFVASFTDERLVRRAEGESEGERLHPGLTDRFLLYFAPIHSHPTAYLTPPSTARCSPPRMPGAAGANWASIDTAVRARRRAHPSRPTLKNGETR